MSDSSPLESRPPTINIVVSPRDLNSSVDNGLRKISGKFFDKFFSSRVSVEAAPDDAKDFVFYAPEGDPNRRQPTPTQFVKVRADPNDETLVRRNDDFEISFVGMSVVPHDTVSYNNNELLLYSLSTRSGASGESTEPEEVVASTTPTALFNERNGNMLNSEHSHSGTAAHTGGEIAMPVPFSVPNHDIPFIHYDPVTDGHDVGDTPFAFTPVPASKAVYLQHCGDTSSPSRGLASVSVRFLVLEIDRISGAQARAIGGMSSTQSFMNSVPMPYLQPVSMAIGAAASLGRSGLKNYSRPDHVISKDSTFVLAEPNTSSEKKSDMSTASTKAKSFETYGNFLRVSCLHPFVYSKYSRYSLCFIIFESRLQRMQLGMTIFAPLAGSFRQTAELFFCIRYFHRYPQNRTDQSH